MKVTAEAAAEGLTFKFQRLVKGVGENATLGKNGREVVLRPLKAGETISVEIHYAE